MAVADGGQLNWCCGQVLRLDEQADRKGKRWDVAELAERVDLVPGSASADLQAVLVLLQDLRLRVQIVGGGEDLEAAGAQEPSQHLLQEVAAQGSFADQFVCHSGDLMHRPALGSRAPSGLLMTDTVKAWCCHCREIATPPGLDEGNDAWRMRLRAARFSRRRNGSRDLADGVLGQAAGSPAVAVHGRPAHALLPGTGFAG